MWRRAQSAVEYLTIVTLSLLIIVPTSYYVLSYTSSLQSRTQANQLSVVGDKILATAEEVYASETGSFIRLDLRLPDSTRDVRVKSGRELVFHLQTRIGSTDVLFFSENVNITNGTGCINCTLPLQAGQNTIKIENNGSEITITS